MPTKNGSDKPPNRRHKLTAATKQEGTPAIDPGELLNGKTSYGKGLFQYFRRPAWQCYTTKIG